jgi:hypothetical protein
LTGERVGAVERAIHHEEASNFAITEVSDNSFADSTGAQDERGAFAEFAEDAFGKSDSSGRDRHWAGAEFGFGADAFANFKRTLKKSIEDGASGAVFVSDAVGIANLAEDFGFAEHHGIEAGGDAE